MTPCTKFSCVLFCLLIGVVVEVSSQKYGMRCIAHYISSDKVHIEIICEKGRTPRFYFADRIDCYEGKQSSKHPPIVEGMAFQNCQLHRMPDIFKYFTNLKQLNVSHTDLQQIRAPNFDGAKALSTLIVSHNELTEILSSSFSNAKELKRVDLSHNQINRIDPFAFDETQHLTDLNLSHNNLSTIDNRTFSTLPNLDRLDLGYNLIEVIENVLFNNLQSVKMLNLKNNRLHRLPCQIFNQLKSIELLDMTENRLGEFNTSCIQSEKPFAVFIDRNRLLNLTLAPNVGEIHAAGNTIKWISIRHHLRNITILDLANNRIGNIPEVISHLSASLKALNVSGNSVDKLNVSTFGQFDHLQHLSMRNTNLSNIQFGTFHHQRKLISLDISNNDLKTVNFEIFWRNFEMLESLHLNENNLTEVDGLNRMNFPKLKEFDISGNLFKCNYLVKFLKQWEHVHLISVKNSSTDRTHVDGIDCYVDAEKKPEKKQTTTQQPIHIAPKSECQNRSDSDRIGNEFTHNMMRSMTFIFVALCILCFVYVVKIIVSLWLANKRIQMDACERKVSYLHEQRKDGDTQSTITMNSTLSGGAC